MKCDRVRQISKVKRGGKLGLGANGVATSLIWFRVSQLAFWQGGGRFAAAAAGKFGKKVIAESASDVRKGASVEEEKRCPAVASAQVVEDFAERGF
jgi:hypothetical protein